MASPLGAVPFSFCVLFREGRRRWQHDRSHLIGRTTQVVVALASRCGGGGGGRGAERGNRVAAILPPSVCLVVYLFVPMGAF